VTVFDCRTLVAATKFATQARKVATNNLLTECVNEWGRSGSQAWRLFIKAAFHHAIQLANRLASWLASCDPLASWWQTWFPTRRRQVRAISTCLVSVSFREWRFRYRAGSLAG